MAAALRAPDSHPDEHDTGEVLLDDISLSRSNPLLFRMPGAKMLQFKRRTVVMIVI